MRFLKRSVCFLLMCCMIFAAFGNTVEAKKSKKQEKPQKVKHVICSDYGTDFIKLSWDRTPNAKGYEVYRSVKKKKGYELIATLKGNKNTDYINLLLKKDTKYFYKVRAFSKVNNEKIYGAYSAILVKRTAKHILEPVTKYTYVPYRSGGTTPNGWDCSGFTKWALKEYYGVDIPKGAAAQGNSGKKISMSNRKKWKPGDVLIYLDGGRIGHVALYIGDNKLMHALNTRLGTIIQDVDYYERWDSGTRLIGVRRFR